MVKQSRDSRLRSDQHVPRSILCGGQPESQLGGIPFVQLLGMQGNPQVDERVSVELYPPFDGNSRARPSLGGKALAHQVQGHGILNNCCNIDRPVDKKGMIQSPRAIPEPSEGSPHLANVVVVAMRPSSRRLNRHSCNQGHRDSPNCT